MVELPSFEQVLQTDKPAVTNLVYDPVTGQHDFAVREPVIRGGVTKYVLSAFVKPQSISNFLAAQRLPPDWDGVVFDSNQRIIARTIAAERLVGQLTADSMRSALARFPEGWFLGPSVEASRSTPHTAAPHSAVGQ